MKAGWEVKPLGEVCDLVGGGTPSKKAKGYYGGSIPWVTVRDMNVETVEITDHTITDIGLKNSSSKIIPKGEIIIASRVGLGKVCKLAADMAINQDLKGVIPKRGREIDRQFLFYWFQSVASFIEENGVGATVQGVKLTFLNAMPFPVVSLEEQKQIVAVLDAAFEGLTRAKENAEANLQNARELFDGVLEATYRNSSGQLAKLSEQIEISHGFAFKSKDFDANGDESLPVVLTPGNYTEEAKINTKSPRTKRFLPKVVPQGYLFASGELTVVMTDLSPKMNILGLPAFVEASNILHNQRIGRIKFKADNLSPRYLYYFLRSDLARNRVKETASGTMVRHTAPTRILELGIPMIELKRQTALVEMLDELAEQVSEMRAIYTTKLNDIADLRQSLLQKAFAGELT